MFSSAKVSLQQLSSFFYFLPTSFIHRSDRNESYGGIKRLHTLGMTFVINVIASWSPLGIGSSLIGTHVFSLVVLFSINRMSSFSLN